jgi:hypothetical protein
MFAILSSQPVELRWPVIFPAHEHMRVEQEDRTKANRRRASGYMKTGIVEHITILFGVFGFDESI